MKNENNLYNVGFSSNNLLKKEKRIQSNTLNYLNKYNQNLKESTELQEAEALNKTMSDARLSYAGAYIRSKNRINKLNEEINYNNTSSLVGMTELVSQVVEEALLLDDEEYSALKPDYKECIRETVFDLLNGSDINENIENKDTLAIMEYIVRKMPSAREGMTLTEDELSNYISMNKPDNIKKSINNLSRNVSSKVAQLMEKEQARAEKIDKEVKAAKGEPEEEDISVEEVLDAIQSGEITEEYLDELLENGEISEELYNKVKEELSALETADQEPEDEEYTDEAEYDEYEDDSADTEDAEGQGTGRLIHIDPDGTTSISMPNGQLALNGDGSMDIQLTEALIEEAFDVNVNELNEFNTEKFVDKTAKKIADKQAGIVKGPGPILLFLFGTELGGAIWAVIRGIRNSKLTGKAKVLYDAITLSNRCKAIVRQIETEVAKGNPDKMLLKQLKDELKAAMKAEAAEVRSGNSRQFSKQYQLAETHLIRETPRCGLLESLAVNEAQNMIARGEGYNPDLCLANAIMYVTITEALNEMDLITITEQEYSKIASAAGGSLNEKTCTSKEYKDRKPVNVPKSETKKETLTETVLVSQQAPILNKSNPDDLAERIRQKRLMEQQNQLLHD